MELHDFTVKRFEVLSIWQPYFLTKNQAVDISDLLAIPCEHSLGNPTACWSPWAICHFLTTSTGIKESVQQLRLVTLYSFFSFIQVEVNDNLAFQGSIFINLTKEKQLHL